MTRPRLPTLERPLPRQALLAFRRMALALALAIVAGPPVAGLVRESYAQDLRIAARVNEDVITSYELQSRANFALATSRVADSADSRARLQRQILSQIIDERLQLQDAKRNGITVVQAEIDERVAMIEAGNGMARGQLRTAIQQAGLPYDMLTEQIKANLAWLKIVRRRLVPQIEVSESEIAEAMRQIRANVGKQESHLAEIFLAVDRPELADDVKRNADRISAQLRGGASFTAMAQQFSQAATAALGGDLGWVLPGAMDPAIERAIANLQPRQISEPIRTAAGWHIIAVIERRAIGRASNPDEVRLKVVQLLLPLPANASTAEAERQSSEARTLMGQVKKCDDLFNLASKTKGATVNTIEALRAGDLGSMRDQALSSPAGTPLGPFRLRDSIQVLAVCSREGGDGMPGRDQIQQNLRAQKIETAARRYMRDLRRHALIEIR